MLNSKQFKHNFLPLVEMSRVEVGGRRVYSLPDGTQLPSVTTVLSQALDKGALDKWKQKVGEEEAKRISTQAATRGTALHKLAENYLLNESNYKAGHMPANIDTFNALKPLIDKHIDTILGIEMPLFSKALNAAGTADLIALYDNKLSVIDFKTSRKPKKEEWIENYFIQATTYSLMFEWMYKISVPQIAILIAVDHEEPQVFVKERSQYVNRVLEIFNPSLAN